MRADEPIRFYMYGTGMSQLADYINQVRYERLMRGYMAARMYRYLLDFAEKAGYPFHDGKEKIDKCIRIAEAYEARARRIKEGM